MIHTLKSLGGMAVAPHHLAAQAARDVLRDGGNAVRFLHAELGGIADEGFPTRQGTSNRQDGQFVDNVRDFSAADDGGVQITATDGDVAAWFTIRMRF